ncbi:Cyclin-T1-3 [Salvia divinorum]|uniref:Cyclin-T1-3 n=1 Tax=Salvia divinorum TaxID=28513 RepID=A0ABD1H3P7_SALDI
MASQLAGEPSSFASDGNFKVSQEKTEESGEQWYFSRKELEENSPSRQNGIDLKKENYLRKSYCTFLQDLGMRLKVPQVTIATAIIFCHRFFLRQSHGKNDRRTIATVCMFLAGKVEETPRPLKDVILVSYEITHKKDPAAVQKIKQKEVYEQQKELTLLGERVVLGTLGYDLNVHHPYKPLVEAIKKFKVAQNALAQVAWNFVNDGLRTSLCLQFKPHHIAAGAIFLAAKFLKVKLPSDGEKVWWQEFDVTPRQLEEVSNQMLELYEQNRVPPSQASEAEGSAGDSQRPPSKALVKEEHGAGYNSFHGGATSKMSLKVAPSRPGSDGHHNRSGPPGVNQARYNEHGSSENNSISDHQGEDEIHEREAVTQQGNSEDTENKEHGDEDQERDAVEPKDKYHGQNVSNIDDSASQLPQDSTKKLDREKIKAALFERRKARGDVTHKIDPLDELERELEDVEVPGDSDKTKRERKQSWPKPSSPEHENTQSTKYSNEAGDTDLPPMKGQSSHEDDFDTVEEGEVEPSDEADREYESPRSIRKRKPGSPLDRNGLGRHEYSERDHKRHLQENHL